MGTSTLHKNKLFFLVAFLAFIYTLTLWKVTSLYCHEHILDTKSRQFKGIEYSPRGIWKGQGLEEYHSWHFNPQLAERLASFFRSENATSILDLGGGAGYYVKEFIREGFFASCYDGSPETQVISHGLCSTMDLTKPINSVKHDWVLSLLVGRQIPSFLENEFISNIHNLNRKGVVIFWGDGKPIRNLKLLRNPKSNSEIRQIFNKLGYEIDLAASKFVQSGDLRDVNYSVQVFRKKTEVKFYNIEINSRFSGREHDMLSTPVYSDVRNDRGEFITIGLTSCGFDKMEEALNLVKSAILFSQHTKLQVVAFVDAETIDQFKRKMKILKQDSTVVNPNFKYHILPTTFPSEIEGMQSWKEIFKPCSAQKLFVPAILPSLDAIIHFDTDSLILANLTDLWQHFSSMDSNAFIGVTQMTEFPLQSWFQLNKFPHYGIRGVNTGMSLMNLTRMRTQNFTKLIIKVRQHYEHLRPNETGDQLLQNVLYNFSPELVSLLPCEWNLRQLHCQCDKAKYCSCNSVLENGVGILHGTNNSFNDGVGYPFFRSICQVFNEYNFTHTITTLLERLTIQFQKNLNKYFTGTCFFKNSSSFYKRLEEYATNLKLD